MRLGSVVAVLVGLCLGSHAGAAEFFPGLGGHWADGARSQDLENGLSMAGRSVVRGQFEDPLVTDRPDFTEASSTVGYGRLQIESGYTYLHDSSQGFGLDDHLLPELLLRYGLTDCVEFRFIWPGYLFSRTTEEATGAATAFDGTSNLYFGTKIDLLEANRWIPETAVIAHVGVPLGEEDVDSEDASFDIVLAYSWDLTECVSLAANTGGAVRSPGGDSFTRFNQSVALGVSWTERIGTFYEWFVLARDGAEDSRPEHYFDSGVTYLVTPNFQLDWRAGVGLTEIAGDFFTGAGFSYRF